MSSGHRETDLGLQDLRVVLPRALKQEEIYFLIDQITHGLKSYVL